MLWRIRCNYKAIEGTADQQVKAVYLYLSAARPSLLCSNCCSASGKERQPAKKAAKEHRLLFGRNEKDGLYAWKLDKPDNPSNDRTRKDSNRVFKRAARNRSVCTSNTISNSQKRVCAP